MDQWLEARARPDAEREIVDADVHLGNAVDGDDVVDPLSGSLGLEQENDFVPLAHDRREALDLGCVSNIGSMSTSTPWASNHSTSSTVP
jgi:hypothetical protein